MEGKGGTAENRTAEEYSAEPGTRYRVANRYGLDMRDKPGTYGRLIQTVKNGTIVETTEPFSRYSDREWVRVRILGDGQEGYVNGLFLR